MVAEPLGGAHRNVEEMATRVKDAIELQLRELESLPTETLVQQRQARLLSFGEFDG